MSFSAVQAASQQHAAIQLYTVNVMLLAIVIAASQQPAAIQLYIVKVMLLAAIPAASPQPAAIQLYPQLFTNQGISAECDFFSHLILID